MKTRNVTFILKGKEFAYDVATFDNLKEAQQLLGNELLNVINLGNLVYAKSMALGKDPFKARKKKYKLDVSKLDEPTLQKLRDLGALLP